MLFGDDYVIGHDVSDPEAILVRSAEVEVDAFPSLLAVARAGVGVNNITIREATGRGIPVFNTPGANANAVAELVFVMLGFVARRIDQAIGFVRELSNRTTDTFPIEEAVEKSKACFAGFELRGKTLGVIGLGKIGVCVANLGVRFGMKVIGFDPKPTIANIHQVDSRVEIVSTIEHVLRDSDIVTVHVPLTADTRHLIGRREIKELKSGCILMNYARSGIYDDVEVLEALREQRIAMYVTDFPTEILLQEQKVICTPHLGASTVESEENCAVMAVRQLKQYVEFGVVNNSVNFPTVSVMPHQKTRARLCVVNRDVPNMIAHISSVLGEDGINIHSFVNESNGVIGYNLVDLTEDVSSELITRIKSIDGVIRVRMLTF